MLYYFVTVLIFHELKLLIYLSDLIIIFELSFFSLESNCIGTRLYWVSGENKTDQSLSQAGTHNKISLSCDPFVVAVRQVFGDVYIIATSYLLSDCISIVRPFLLDCIIFTVYTQHFKKS